MRNLTEINLPIVETLFLVPKVRRPNSLTTLDVCEAAPKLKIIQMIAALNFGVLEMPTAITSRQFHPLVVTADRWAFLSLRSSGVVFLLGCKMARVRVNAQLGK